ncbi:MAG: hypothetical protein IT473_03230 [Lysobacter sp.]|nr:hypothetical protein [Lysobacter sp.]
MKTYKKVIVGLSLAGVLTVLSAISFAQSVVTIGDYTYICPNECVVHTGPGGTTIHDSEFAPIRVEPISKSPEQ